MKQWEVMLAELNAERAQTEADYEAKNIPITRLGERLNKVFNAEAALYIFVPITPWGKRRLNQARQDATALTDSLTAQVQQHEFNYDQLGALLNQLKLTLRSSISPGIREDLDDSMRQQGASLMSIVKAAFDASSEAYSMEWKAHKARLCDCEEKIFHQFLREEPKAATIIRNMIAQPEHTYRIASSFGDDQNIVTDDDMVILDNQIRLMLREAVIPGEIVTWMEYEDQGRDPEDNTTRRSPIFPGRLAATIEAIRNGQDKPARILYALNGSYARPMAIKYFNPDRQTADLETPKL